MKVRSLETFKITLPFRLSFGHALASRQMSQNLIVKLTLDNGICGWGEGIPRDYVTGENIEEAERNLLFNYAEKVMDLPFEDKTKTVLRMQELFSELELDRKSQGASWCALELAVLDALAKLHNLALFEILGKQVQKEIVYGATLPFASEKKLSLILHFYKLYGYQTVKLKVGEKDLWLDIARLKLARKILGEKVILRVDANCAWNLEQAMRAAEAFSPFKISSIEQPLAASDFAGLVSLNKSIPQQIVLDESLCTLKQAKELAQASACSAFNIRISKVGGLLPSGRMLDIAREHGLAVHLGAQVGETAILSAAARHFAVLHEKFENYEGSANFFLLKQDVCKENLTVGFKGIGSLKYSGKTPGLGVNVMESRIFAMSQSCWQEGKSSSESESNSDSESKSKAALCNAENEVASESV